MTKEELEKEAEEWLCNNLHSANEEDFIKAMVDIAEPREKRIAELEAQIEKMKCCENCKNYNNFHRHCEFDATNSVECHCNNYKLWEDKRK